MVLQFSRTLKLYLENCAIVESSWALDTTFMETYPNVLTTGDIVRIWVFWDVMPCDCVIYSCRFESSCHLQSVGNHPWRDTVLTTWKTWILINTTLRTLDVRYHNVACPHVACTVQATLCHMHWTVLTHPLVNLDQYPFDFHVFSPFKKVPNLSQMKSGMWCSNPGRSPRNFFWRRSMD